jgi:tyrosyl-tRNA synthetase
MTRIETFADVMIAFPFDDLWELLNKPRAIDARTFEYVVNWCRPRVPSGVLCFDAFADVVVKSGLFASRGEVIRKVKEGAMKWNGSRVSDANMPVGFLDPGWGVIQLGKRTHKVVLEEK